MGVLVIPVVLDALGPPARPTARREGSANVTLQQRLVLRGAGEGAADSVGAGAPGTSQSDTGGGDDGNALGGGDVVGGTRHPVAGAGLHVPVDACTPSGNL